MIGIHPDAEAHAQHALLPWGQRGQNAGRGFLQVFLNGAVQRQDGVLVFDEIAKLAVFLIPDRGFQRNRFLGDLHHLADLFQRHLQLFCQLFRRRLAADLVQHLPARAHQLVDRLDHVHRNADGAGLIGDAPRDGLADPPGGIGGKLVAAPVFELVHRLHQADIAFLNKIKELQPAVRVFFCNRDHQTQVRLDHFLLGLARLFLALLDLVHDPAEFADVDAHILADLRHFAAQLFHAVAAFLHQRLPAPARLGRHAVGPGRVQLAALIFVDEFAPVDPRGIGQLHHARVDRHDLAVDPVKLVDQRFDPVVVQVQFVHQQHDLAAQLLIGGLVIGGKPPRVIQRGRHPQILHLGQLDVIARDHVQRFQHARLQRGFHRCQRHGRRLIIVVLILGGDNRVAVGIQLRLFQGGPARGCGHVHAVKTRLIQPALALGVQRPAKGGLKIDHIAQQNVFGQKLVAPDGDGLKGQRAFAQARDHGVASGLDPLGDGNLALAAQQFDRSHLAQIHAHRIVGAVQRFRGGARYGHFARGGRGFHKLARRLALFGLVILDDVDAHFGQHRHHILDLFRGHLFGRQDRVELVIGDVAALARIGDHLLDGGLAHVERDFGVLFFGFAVVGVFECHACSSEIFSESGCRKANQ